MQISKIRAAWAMLTGGVEGLVEYLLDLFNKFIQNVPAAEMYRYCGVVEAIAVCLKTIFGLFVDKLGERKTEAIKATILALENLAKALSDNRFSKDELDKFIDDVKNAVEAWKVANATPVQIEAVTATMLTVAVFMITGCKAFYENAGSRTVVGSVTSPIEISEPTSSCNVRALYSMDGADVYTAKDSLVKIKYANQYTNDYFYIVKTQGKQDLEVEIEPLAVDVETNATNDCSCNGCSCK